MLDEHSKKIVDNVVKEDDILNQNIASMAKRYPRGDADHALMGHTDIERIEDKRDMNPTMDAIYLLSPQAHIVDCVMADFERHRYRRAFLVWTGVLDPQLRRRIDSSPIAQQQLAGKFVGGPLEDKTNQQISEGFETLTIDFFPRESHLITFRDPWSFPILYHPACNQLVREHMQTLAQRVSHG